MPVPSGPNANNPQPNPGTSYRTFAMDRTGADRKGRKSKRGSRKGGRS